MANNDWNLNYGRQDLRKATKFTEGDYSGINPRQFYRTLKRTLEELQEGGDFKYTTLGSQNSNFTIESETVGEKTGTVKGRLVAISDWRKIDSGTIDYKPYGPHGALAVSIGILFLLLGINSWQIGLLGVIGIVGGGYLYFQDETGEFPVHRQDGIRTLMTGEVSERTLESGTESRTDIFANMSVIYAGDTFVNVHPQSLEEVDWPLRQEITRQVKKWHNRIADDEHEEVEIEEGFLAMLKSWTDRNPQSDISTVRNLQDTLNNDFDKRLQYSNILLDQLPRDARDELEEHQDALLDELEDLAEDMDVYVEREGLEAKS